MLAEWRGSFIVSFFLISIPPAKGLRLRTLRTEAFAAAFMMSWMAGEAFIGLVDH